MDTISPGRSLPNTPTPACTVRSRTASAANNPAKHRASVAQLRSWAQATSHGDDRAFPALYAACREWVQARCREAVGASNAEDVCAEVFTRTWRHLHAGKTIEHPLAWLATVTRHAILDHRKRAARSGVVETSTENLTEIPDEAPGPLELAAAADVVPVVTDWLAELPPRTRQVVQGHLAGEDQSVTGERVGCSVAAVRSSLYRARQGLRTRLARRAFGYPFSSAG